jgi:hypothetical protein
MLSPLLLAPCVSAHGRGVDGAHKFPSVQHLEEQLRTYHHAVRHLVSVLFHQM